MKIISLLYTIDLVVGPIPNPCMHMYILGLQPYVKCLVVLSSLLSEQFYRFQYSCLTYFLALGYLKDVI